MIKKQLVVGLCLTLAAGLSCVMAAESMKADPGKTLSSSSASTSEKMEAIDSYVAHVEKKLKSYTRKEESLPPDSLKNITDESWSKMHGYFDGQTLMRMKLYPAKGSEKTEEFYFYKSELVFAFVEEHGSGKDGHDENAVGSKYYFADGKLIGATGPDGKPMEMASAPTEQMSAKLQKEATALQGMLK